MSLINELALYEKIGAIIKNRRRSLKLTQSYVADRVGITRTSVTNIEKGAQKTPLYTLYKLAVILDMSPNEMLPALEDVVMDVEQQEEVITFGDKTQEVTPRTKELLERLIG
ncbi:MAG: helix-turn-helix domain-containing protein [Candidatus Thiodiazotropha taylori]|nr:helix-turn-helix domain-containing protein [Candidatus Thiodiazotropha taylori]